MNNGVFYRVFIASCAALCAGMSSVSAIYEDAGFYAGVSAGAVYNAGSFRGEAIEIATGEVINTHDKSSTCCFGKDFGGFFGYMAHLSRSDWLAGLEFGIEKHFCKKHFSTTLWDDHLGILDAEDCQYRIKPLYTAKLHAKLGKVLEKRWFVYGLLGVDMRRTEVRMCQEILGETYSKKSSFGVALGLGVEREINENWRLGLELVNTCYRPQVLKGYNTDGSFRINSRIRTNVTQISLRLVYNF